MQLTLKNFACFTIFFFVERVLGFYETLPNSWCDNTHYIAKRKILNLLPLWVTLSKYSWSVLSKCVGNDRASLVFVNTSDEILHTRLVFLLFARLPAELEVGIDVSSTLPLWTSEKSPECLKFAIEPWCDFFLFVVFFPMFSKNWVARKAKEPILINLLPVIKEWNRSIIIYNCVPTKSSFYIIQIIKFFFTLMSNLQTQK